MTGRTEPLTIRIERPLDMLTSTAVVERLRSVERDRDVVIEFAPRVECDLVVLSLMAQAIERLNVRVSVQGLSGHDMRILRYLGISFVGAADPHRPD